MAGIPAITTQLQRTASAADIFSSNVLTSQFASTTAPTSMMSSSISRITDTMSPQNSSLLLNSLSSVDQSNPLYHHNFLVQDQRTLQLAVELSLAGLNDATAVTATSSVQTPVSNADIHSRAAHAINYQHQLLHRHVMNQEDLCSLKAMSSAVSTATNGNIEHIGSCGNGAVTSTNILSSNGSNNITLNDFFTANSMLTSAIDDRSKKSQNMTECVPVPSSEHVAEIVGRQEIGVCNPTGLVLVLLTAFTMRNLEMHQMSPKRRNFLHCFAQMDQGGRYEQAVRTQIHRLWGLHIRA